MFGFNLNSKYHPKVPANIFPKQVGTSGVSKTFYAQGWNMLMFSNKNCRTQIECFGGKENKFRRSLCGIDEEVL